MSAVVSLPSLLRSLSPLRPMILIGDMIHAGGKMIADLRTSVYWDFIYSSRDPQQGVLDDTPGPSVSSNLIVPANTPESLPTLLLDISDLAAVSSPSSLSDEQRYQILTEVGPKLKEYPANSQKRLIQPHWCGVSMDTIFRISRWCVLCPMLSVQQSSLEQWICINTISQLEKCHWGFSWCIEPPLCISNPPAVCWACSQL